jgi:alcohol dehydrogenase
VGVNQLTLTTERRLEWREVAKPKLAGDGEAIVRPLAVARCDIDLPYVRGDLVPPRDFALGHECVGEIVDLSDDVKSLRLGQRVIVPFQISCGDCERCKRGHTGTCERVPFLSSYGLPLSPKEWGGALSDALRVPFAEAMLVPAPGDVPAWSLAAAADNACDGWRCVASQLRARPGASVLVVAGQAPSVGLYAADAALGLGASRVDFVAQNAELLRVAESLGCRTQDAPFAAVRGAWPITVDASGDPDGLITAVRSTEPEGVCTVAAFYAGDTPPLPLGRMYSKGISLHTGRVHARVWLPEVAEAIAQGKLHPERITTRRANWREATDAMAEPAAKLVLDREEGLSPRVE